MLLLVLALELPGVPSGTADDEDGEVAAVAGAVAASAAPTTLLPLAIGPGPGLIPAAAPTAAAPVLKRCRFTFRMHCILNW